MADMKSNVNPRGPSEPRIADEMRKMAAEPLLPIEKKLIGWSLGLGIVLLVVLMVVARMVVPHG